MTIQIRNEKEYICDRITEYANLNKGSERRLSDFLNVNGFKEIKDCQSLQVLELLFRIETFMYVENEVKNEQ